MTEDGIAALIDQRHAALAAKDQKQAENIRATLASHGVVITDVRGGTRWRKETMQ